MNTRTAKPIDSAIAGRGEMRLDAGMESGWTLKNETLEVALVGGPSAYAGSRFDHSGQVQQITFRGEHTVLGTEKPRWNPAFGFGLHHEFDITEPAQYPGTESGQPFHKIGVGLLRRDDASPYFFATPYRVVHALDWTVEQPSAGALSFTTLSPENRGLQYLYTKTLTLHGDALQIDYRLENQGSETLATVHYSHNFLCLNNTPIGPDYELSVDATIDPSAFREYVDPDACLSLDRHSVRWTASPKSDFFIGHLVIPQPGPHGWTLIHLPTGLRLSESVDFEPTHFNLWGQGHVISPELFHALQLQPGEAAQWQRRFQIELG